MIVNGNVNGDFVDSNDLAYVYDPNSSAILIIFVKVLILY